MKTITLILLLAIFIGCVNKKSTYLEKQISNKLFLTPSYYNKSNPADSSIIWIPIPYTIKNFDSKKTKAIISNIANKQHLYYSITDYNLFRDSTLQKEWITINNSPISNKFIFVSNHIKLSNNDLKDILGNTQFKNISDPIQITRSIKLDSAILKQIVILNNREDTIYLRLINDKGKTIQILKEKINYN